MCSTSDEGNKSPWLFSHHRRSAWQLQFFSMTADDANVSPYNSLVPLQMTGISVLTILWHPCTSLEYKSLQFFGWIISRYNYFILFSSFVSTKDKRNFFIVAHHFPFIRFAPPPPLKWLSNLSTVSYFSLFSCNSFSYLSLYPFAHTLSYPLHSSGFFYLLCGWVYGCCNRQRLGIRHQRTESEFESGSLYPLTRICPCERYENSFCPHQLWVK